MVKDDTCDASTQDRSDSTVPRPIRLRGPNRSTSQPCSGEKNVWSTISSENVTCNAAGDVASAAPIGLVNNAQTYCGLEIVIMKTGPRPSWAQRVELDAGVRLVLL